MSKNISWDKLRSQDYSPLRPLREQDKLFLNNEVLRDRDNLAYQQLKNKLFQGPKVHKQILDMYVNHLKDDPNRLKKINIRTTMPRGSAGLYNRDDQTMDINANIVDNLIRTLNHELTHVVSDKNQGIPGFLLKDLKKQVTKKILKGAQQNPIFKQNIESDPEILQEALGMALAREAPVNYDPQFSVDNRIFRGGPADIIRKWQDIVDNTGNFRRGYIPGMLHIPGENSDITKYQKRLMKDREGGERGAFFWGPDEFNAHAVQNIDNNFVPSNNATANKYARYTLEDLASRFHQYGSSNYPDINYTILNGINKLKQPRAVAPGLLPPQLRPVRAQPQQLVRMDSETFFDANDDENGDIPELLQQAEGPYLLPPPRVRNQQQEERLPRFQRTGNSETRSNVYNRGRDAERPNSHDRRTFRIPEAFHNQHNALSPLTQRAYNNYYAERSSNEQIAGNPNYWQRNINNHLENQPFPSLRRQVGQNQVVQQPVVQQQHGPMINSNPTSPIYEENKQNDDQNQDQYYRGGRVTKPRHHQSNFNMQKAIQILELLTRGMA